ncbi:MAG TPA: hypothetical protein DCZ95_14455 [Verrucomicrobia bacterium]|nr:hypothetical protein [Verrucomicrobiota bacterium]
MLVPNFSIIKVEVFRFSPAHVVHRAATDEYGEEAERLGLLVHAECFDDDKSALGREKWLKMSVGRAFLRTVLSARVAKWQTQRT